MRAMPGNLISDAQLQRILSLYERHVATLSGGAALVLVALIAMLAARLVWMLVPVPEAAAWRPAPMAAVSPASAGERPIDLASLTRTPLFGRYEAASDTAEGDLHDAPDTRLSLTLMGVLASDSPSARALIAASNGEEKPYAIGAQVIPGVELKAIFSDRVVLARNGALETLRLDKNAPSRATAARPVENLSPSGAAMASLTDIRSQVLADPTKAANYLRVQPANVNGQLRGYRVYPGRERDAFQQLGLRPGDLVTAVNGVELNDPQKALQLLSQLSQASLVEVTIQRGGQTQSLSLNFN